jgi:hypothetical protein
LCACSARPIPSEGIFFPVTIVDNSPDDADVDSPREIHVAGHKQSGTGVENGDLGVLEYTNLQTTITIPAPSAGAAP